MRQLCHNHALETDGKGITTMIKKQAEGTRISCSPRLLSIQLIQYSVSKIAESLGEKHPPLEFRCCWVFVLQVGAEEAKEEYERCCWEKETGERDQIRGNPLRYLIHQPSAEWAVEESSHDSIVTAGVFVLLHIGNLLFRQVWHNGRALPAPWVDLVPVLIRFHILVSAVSPKHFGFPWITVVHVNWQRFLLLFFLNLTTF